MSAANEADFFAESSLTKQDISSSVCQDVDAYNAVQHHLYLVQTYRECKSVLPCTSSGPLQASPVMEGPGLRVLNLDGDGNETGALVDRQLQCLHQLTGGWIEFGGRLQFTPAGI